MNRRKKKKFRKKLNNKTYYNYRRSKIISITNKYKDDNSILYILDSRRGNLKHLQKVTLLQNVRPTSSQPKEIKLSFKSQYSTQESLYNNVYKPIIDLCNLLFGDTIKEANMMNFGEALKAVKEGKKIARTGWNGKGMFVYYVPAGNYPPSTDIAKGLVDEDGLVPYNAYFAIKNVNGTVSTWVPSVNDCLAEDWIIVE